MNKVAGFLLLSLLGAPEGVRETRDLAYYDGADADPGKQKLDLFMPRDAKKVPVVMWIHGGGWMIGDRSMYGELGRRFAESGIGLAAISYRLSPKVKHPAHVEDCARAFAWLRDHVADYGGDPDRLFVSGQSAGGHLSALLTLDLRYLRALHVPDGAIKGSIPMSGVYTIPALPAESKGLMSMFPDSFGSDPEVCRAASPITHIANLSCPMLVITESEDVGLVRPSMKLFQRAAEKAGVKDIRFMDAEQRNHLSIVMNLARKADDVREAMVEFVQKRCKDLDSK
jgi:acetyl esterase/lipase